MSTGALSPRNDEALLQTASCVVRPIIRAAYNPPTPPPARQRASSGSTAPPSGGESQTPARPGTSQLQLSAISKPRALRHAGLAPTSSFGRPVWPPPACSLGRPFRRSAASRLAFNLLLSPHCLLTPGAMFSPQRRTAPFLSRPPAPRRPGPLPASGGNPSVRLCAAVM